MLSKGSVAKRLILYSLLFSSMITLFVTLGQVYLDYRAGISDYEKQFKEIEAGFLSSITLAVWYIDKEETTKQLRGISELPDIAEVILYINDDPTGNHLKSNLKADGPSKRLPLIYIYQGSPRQLGYLTVTTSLESLYDRLIKKFALVLLFNLIKALSVTGFTLLIFNKLVSQPLKVLADQTSRLSNEQNTLLQKKVFDLNIDLDRNEIEYIENAIEQMRENFNESFAALKTSQDRIEDLVTFSFDYVFETDAKFKFTYLHKNIEHLDYMSRYFYMNASLFELPFNKDQLFNIHSKQALKEQLIPVVAEGKTYYVELSLKPLIVKQKFQGYRGVIVNVTDKILANNFAEVYKQRLEQFKKSQVINQSGASMVSDFFHCLMHAKNRLSEFKIHNDLNPKQSTSIEQIDATLTRGLKQVTHLRRSAKSGAPQLEVTNINSLLNSLKPAIEDLIHDRILINYNFTPEVWNCHTDPALLENSIIHLTRNAIDAMPFGGLLTVETQNVTIGQDYSDAGSSAKPGQYVAIKVIDTGLGMTEQTKARLFEPFFTTKESDQNMGLGLNLVKSFVSQSEGSIKVDSQYRAGSTFVLYLPRYVDTKMAV